MHKTEKSRRSARGAPRSKCSPRAKAVIFCLFCLLAAAGIVWIANRFAGGGITVCLDAGHGGGDPGASALGYIESEDTLEMTLRIADYLEKKDCRVILTRSDDSYLELKERPRIANEAGADVLVSIHRNMVDGDPSVSGVEAWINSAGPQDAYVLSECILRHIGATRTMDVSRGVRRGVSGDPSQDYAINSKSRMASCILELGFISSEEDNRYYHEEMDSIAKAVAEGILEAVEQIREAD